MAQTPFSLLLLRRFSSQNPNLHHRRLPSFIRTTITTTTHSYYLTSKPFSSSLSPLQPTPPNPSDPNTLTLSARMSFVFDQIDAIEKDRSTKDQALQRIRTWRESKKKNTTKDHTLGLGSGFTETIDSNESDSTESGVKKEREGLLTKEVELAHPWPEWIELMERLVQQNYFDHRRKDEDKMMVSELGFDMSEVAEEGFDFTRDWKTVQTACLNFGRDRFDILRSLSRQDIQILVGYGCPNVDKKVVFSAKLLRKHVHLDEGDVCSSCSLRSSCERAYLVTNKEDEARTLDVVRVLLTFGFDPVNGSVINKSLLKLKSVKTVVRKLLHEVVKLSAVPIDPNLPPPVIKKPPPKVKQPPPPPRKRVGRDDIEMKKGDWLCPKCDFMNFAKNTVCLQCDAKRPKRQLLPGEWECPECNFLNYRRNVACFHCEHKRPPDEFMEIQKQERQHGPRMRLDKVASRSEVSNAWNFDFDDDESDGADVAAFEFADSPRMGEDSPLDSRAQGGNFRGPEDDLYKASRTPRAHEREYSDPDHKKPGIGFDDFDDEEDDDVDSYELDNSPVQKASSNAISGVEEYSEFEDIEGFDDNLHGRRRTSSPSNNKPSKQIRRKAAFSGSEDDEVGFDSDEELPVHPNWKSSHVADSRQRSRGRGPMSFGSDEELGLASGSDDDLDENFGSRQSKGNKMGSGRRDSRQSKGNRMGSSRRDVRRRGNSDIEDDSFSGSESDDNDLHSHRNKLRGNKAGPDRRGNTLRGREDFDFAGDTRFRSKGMMGDRRNSFNDNFDRSSRGSHGNNRGSRGDDSGGHRMNDRGGNLRHFDGPRREGSGNRQHGRFNKFDNRNDRGDDLRNFDGPRREGSGNRQRGKFNKFDNRNDRGGDLRNFDGPRREGSGNQQRGRFNKFDNRSDMGSDFGNDRPRRQRIIER